MPRIIKARCAKMHKISVISPKKLIVLDNTLGFSGKIQHEVGNCLGVKAAGVKNIFLFSVKEYSSVTIKLLL